MEGLKIDFSCLRDFFSVPCEEVFKYLTGEALLADSLGISKCFAGSIYVISPNPPKTSELFIKGQDWKPFCVVPLPRRFDSVAVFSANPSRDFEPSVRFVVNHLKKGGYFLLNLEEGILPFAVNLLSEFASLKAVFPSLVVGKLLEFPF